MSNAIFVMNFMTFTAYESEIDEPGLEEMGLHDAAAPHITSLSTTGSDEWIAACRKMVMDELAAEDEDLYEDGEEIGAYTWEDGQWNEPEDGFPNRTFIVMQDGEAAAAMVIQRRPMFD